MTEKPDMPPSPETQIAMLNERMVHLLEKIEHVSSQQDVLIGLAKSVAIHDSVLEGVEKRLQAAETRQAENTTVMMTQLHDISKQITESNRQADDKNKQSIDRVHQRLDIQDKQIADSNRDQDERIEKAEKDIVAAHSMAKTLYVIGGLAFSVLVGCVAWAFQQIGQSHDENIRQDEHIKVIEQHLDKAEKGAKGG